MFREGRGAYILGGRCPGGKCPRDKWPEGQVTATRHGPMYSPRKLIKDFQVFIPPPGIGIAKQFVFVNHGRPINLV